MRARKMRIDPELKGGRRRTCTTVAACLAMLVMKPGYADGPGHPSTAVMPDLDDLLSDRRRGLVLDILVTNLGVELRDAVVSDVPTGATDDDPPLLRLEALDAGGLVVESFYTWDPRWEYIHGEDGEYVEPADAGESIGTFEIPFDHRIRRVVLDDVQTNPPLRLGEVDVSSTVLQFCTSYPQDPNCDRFVADLDQDGIADAQDLCPDTAIPEAIPTSGSLGENRWALLGPDDAFTQAPPRQGNQKRFTTADTRGCSCEQLVERMGLGQGHSTFGCTTGAIEDWIGTVVPADS